MKKPLLLLAVCSASAIAAASQTPKEFPFEVMMAGLINAQQVQNARVAPLVGLKEFILVMKVENFAPGFEKIDVPITWPIEEMTKFAKKQWIKSGFSVFTVEDLNSSRPEKSSTLPVVLVAASSSHSGGQDIISLSLRLHRPQNNDINASPFRYPPISFVASSKFGGWRQRRALEELIYRFANDVRSATDNSLGSDNRVGKSDIKPFRAGESIETNEVCAKEGAETCQVEFAISSIEKALAQGNNQDAIRAHQWSLIASELSMDPRSSQHAHRLLKLTKVFSNKVRAEGEARAKQWLSTFNHQ